MKLAPAIAALLLPLLCCFTCATDSAGNKFVTTDDFGIVTTRTGNTSGGGPLSLISGSSRGERTTERIESENAPRIQVGSIDITGPIDSSTRTGERWFGIGMLSRTIAQARSIAKMFDFAGRRVEAIQGTDRARINAESGVDRARIEAAAEAAAATTTTTP